MKEFNPKLQDISTLNNTDIYKTCSELICYLKISDKSNLNVKFYNICFNNNILFIGQLITLTESKFESIKGVGTKLLTLVKNALLTRGLSFKDSIQPTIFIIIKSWALSFTSTVHLHSFIKESIADSNRNHIYQKQKSFIKSVEYQCSFIGSNYIKETLKSIHLI